MSMSSELSDGGCLRFSRPRNRSFFIIILAAYKNSNGIYS